MKGGILTSTCTCSLHVSLFSVSFAIFLGRISDNRETTDLESMWIIIMKNVSRQSSKNKGGIRRIKRGAHVHCSYDSKGRQFRRMGQRARRSQKQAIPPYSKNKSGRGAFASNDLPVNVPLKDDGPFTHTAKRPPASLACMCKTMQHSVSCIACLQTQPCLSAWERSRCPVVLQGTSQTKERSWSSPQDFIVVFVIRFIQNHRWYLHSSLQECHSSFVCLIFPSLVLDQ